MKRSNGDKVESTPDCRNEFYLISVMWINLALPFLEEFIKNTNKADELFNLNKIYVNFVNGLLEKKKENVKINDIAYPGYINNHEILEYKCSNYWIIEHKFRLFFKTNICFIFA